ncbi:MAG: hypothetical protein KatS3mg004_3063 [Bryobacteraceae bacterium]|nr:MAG: hypothetical protein KatS3mg004_3063 [Bryobacteraceae bacterium]
MTYVFHGVGLVSILMSRSSQNQARERKLSFAQTIEGENVVAQVVIIQSLRLARVSTPTFATKPFLSSSTRRWKRAALSYQGMSWRSRKKPPVGPSGGRVASHTAVSAPSSGVRGAAGCGWRCGGEQLVLSHQAQHAPQGSAYAAQAQPWPTPCGGLRRGRAIPGSRAGSRRRVAHRRSASSAPLYARQRCSLSPALLVEGRPRQAHQALLALEPAFKKPSRKSGAVQRRNGPCKPSMTRTDPPFSLRSSSAAIRFRTRHQPWISSSRRPIRKGVPS